jgi:hypothetical protein
MGPETEGRDLGAHPAWNPSNGNVSSSILTSSAQKLPIEQSKEEEKAFISLN